MRCKLLKNKRKDEDIEEMFELRIFLTMSLLFIILFFLFSIIVLTLKVLLRELEKNPFNYNFEYFILMKVENIQIMCIIALLALIVSIITGLLIYFKLKYSSN